MCDNNLWRGSLLFIRGLFFTQEVVYQDQTLALVGSGIFATHGSPQNHILYLVLDFQGHTYLPTYLPTYVPTYVRTYVRTYVHTYIPTYIPTYLPTYLPTYVPTYVRTYARTYIHTYIHTYVRRYDVHTYVRTYIHTYIIIYIYVSICLHTSTPLSKVDDTIPPSFLASFAYLGVFTSLKAPDPRKTTHLQTSKRPSQVRIVAKRKDPSLGDLGKQKNDGKSTAMQGFQTPSHQVFGGFRMSRIKNPESK